MKSILVILLVGTTVALEADKCKPDGYCRVKYKGLKRFVGLVGKVEPDLPKPVIIVEAHRQQVPEGFNYVVMFVKMSSGPMEFCVVRIFEESACDEETGKVERKGKLSCAPSDLRKAQEVVKKIVQPG